MSAETLEMPVEQTPEQKRDQLISEYEDLALQLEKEKERIEMMDSGKAPLENYPSFVKLQEAVHGKEKEIEAVNQAMESVETTQTPEVVAAGKIVEEKFNDLEKGIATQHENAKKELERLNAAIKQTDEDLKTAQGDEKLGLNIIRLGLQRKADNIQAGIKLEEERGLKMAA